MGRSSVVRQLFGPKFWTPVVHPINNKQNTLVPRSSGPYGWTGSPDYPEILATKEKLRGTGNIIIQYQITAPSSGNTVPKGT